ncbi:glutathione-dependent formaldehyde-activating GFA [Rhizobium sp. CF080]|uniref:GFA family protein n=1 Tax=Rhizobium sp. (strain CF080) TaxID=1144310 RepID=UPI0002717805|nr:GFA family protein [Rhizobium sp. CF080]EUB95158.1 glutathione-dependent formaldehyde-activating GFA [Rhizobium sp. CF080]
MERIATCACGKLQAICQGEPAKVSLCHCLECQKRTGSTYGIAAFFDRAQVRIEGESKTYARLSDSGFAVNLHFCPDCGSTVFWEPQRKPDVIAVGIGSFADPGFPAPSQEVYDQHRHPWVPVLG